MDGEKGPGSVCDSVFCNIYTHNIVHGDTDRCLAAEIQRQKTFNDNRVAILYFHKTPGHKFPR